MRPRVALIGCGALGRPIARALASLGALAAVSDPDAACADEAGGSIGAPVRSEADLLADPSIDGVAIVAPAVYRASLSARALVAGKHVFVAAPHALTIAEAETLISQADRAGRVLMVGHTMRHHPAVTALIGLARDGRLGQLLHIEARRAEPLLLGRGEEIFRSSVAAEEVAIVLALAGASPESVNAHGHGASGASAVGTIHLNFPGGLRADITLSRLHPVRERLIVVAGDRGVAVLDDAAERPGTLVLHQHRGDAREGAAAASAAPLPIAVEPAEPLDRALAHFLDCIASGRRAITGGEEGLAVLRVLSAAEAAAGPRPGIHPSVEIAPDAHVGDGTWLWHMSRVLSGSRVGVGCRIGQNVVIGPNVQVGDRCKIQNNVSVYEGVTIEDEVFVGPSAVFTNVRWPRAAIDRRGEFAPTLVRRGATIGANATVLCGVTIGEWAFVAAGSVVTRDVAPFALVAGVPARRIGWVGHAGERLVRAADGVYTCPRTGRRYRESTPGTLEECP